MRPRSIYLVSPAGVPNFGDEIIAKGWLTWLSKHLPEAEVWMDCQSPGKAAPLLAGIHPRLYLTDTLWRTMWDASTEEGCHRERGPAAVVRDLASPNYDVGLLNLREMDLIHFIGGGHITNVWPAHIGLIRAALAVKDFYGVRVVGTGLGLAPLIPTIQHLVRQFDYISVRDSASADATNAVLARDDAVLASNLEIARNPVRQPEFTVCIQEDLRSDDEFRASIDFVADYINTYRGRIGKVRYVEAIPGTDFRAYAELSRRLRDIEFVPFTSVWLDGLPLGAQQVWLTTRFHHHIFGALAGARGIALASGGAYYGTKHASAASLGSNWMIVDPMDQTAPPPGELARPAIVGSPNLDKNHEAMKIYLN